MRKENSFLFYTFSIECAAVGALAITSSICWSTNTFESGFFKLFVVPVPVIFVVDANASEPSIEDALGTIKRRGFDSDVVGVIVVELLFPWSCTA